jgi:hypothetical protein
MEALPIRHGVTRAVITFACLIPLSGTAATLSTIQFNTAGISSVQLGTIQDSKIGIFEAAPTATVTRDTTAVVNGTTFTDQAFVEVSPAALRARGSVSATAGPNAASYLSQVTASVNDGFRIDSALYDGQLARVEYSLDLSGMLEPFLDAGAGAGTPAIANSIWRLSSGCLSIAQCAQTVYSGTSSFNGGLLLPSGDSVGRLDFVLEVAFGTTINLVTVLDLTNQLLFGNLQTGTGVEGVTGSASADFTNTVVWGGIQSVKLGDGTVVSDWTTSSGSGFDYGTASVIPLPPAAWLLGSARLVVGARRRYS